MIFDPPFPVLLIVALGAAAIGTALRREFFSKPRRKLQPASLHPVCLLLRLSTIAVLLFLLLNPSRQRTLEPVEGRSVILLDASASMSLPGDEQGGSRWESASAFARSARDELAAAGLGGIELMTFSAELDGDGVAETPTGRKSNLAGALESVLATPGAGTPEQILVASDGRIHDRERLDAALLLAKAARVPISTRVFGIDRPPRNASLETVQAPRMVRPKSPAAVHVDVTGTGIAADEALVLKLRDDAGTVLAERELYLPESHVENPGKGRPAEAMLVFDSGLRTGRYHLELTTPGEPEIDLADNRFSFTLEIASEKLRVLYAEGTHEKRPIGDSGHCWNNMEHKTRAWAAAGDIEFETLTPVDNRSKIPNLVGVTFHNGEMRLDPSRDFPKTREALHQFDVLMMCGIQRGNFSEEQLQWVVDWVLKRGGGFMMGGGGNSFDRGEYDKTPWEQIIPVDMKAYGQGLYNVEFNIDVPETARRHPIWRISPNREENHSILDTLPHFLGMNRVIRAKPGAILLATRREIGEPIIAAQRYGRGRSLAFLPDTNGAWGRFFMDWGPSDEPQMNTFINLGLGKDFIFNEAAAVVPDAPEPKNPGRWFRQFWVNAVRWLGQDSVRWQRDKLLGRVVSAQAHPGEKLPVAAEVPAVHELEELLALDVGARLDLPGARRVRLLYDRDRREFTGELSVPAHAGDDAEQLGVLFDAVVGERTFSEALNVGVNRANPEFKESAPDPVFMAGLARATNGTVLAGVQDAVRSSQEAAEKRAGESVRSWSEPLWSEWWPWTIIAVLLSIEWALRRRGGQPPIEREAGATAETETETSAVPVFSAGRSAVLLAGAILVFTNGIVFSQEEKSIADWVEQLGSDRVRLRDEAEDFLRKTPASQEALANTMESAESDEMRVRARNILRHLRQSHRWKLVATRVGHTPGKVITNRGLVASPDGTRFFSRARDWIRVYDSETLAPGVTFGDSNYQVEEGWLRLGPASTLAISPDGKRIASANEFGEIIIHDAVRLVEKARFADPKSAAFAAREAPNKPGTIFGAVFFSDSKTLAVAERTGVRLWNIETEQEIWFSKTEKPAFWLAVSPDETKLIVSVDLPPRVDRLVTLDAKTGKQVAEIRTPARLGGLVFDSTGKRLLAFGRDGFARIYDYSPDKGTLREKRQYRSQWNRLPGRRLGTRRNNDPGNQLGQERGPDRVGRGQRRASLAGTGVPERPDDLDPHLGKPNRRVGCQRNHDGLAVYGALMNFDPPFPIFVIVALAAAAIGLAIRREFFRNRRRLHPRWIHPLCLALRIGAVAALAFLLLNPSLRRSAERTASQTVILLDASASMSLSADEENRSRWEVACEFANATIDEVTAAGLPEPRLSTFSNGLDVVEVAETPDGQVTHLAGALERLLAGSAAEAPDQIIVLSDGRIHDRDQIDAALSLAKAVGAPISTRTFGIDRPPRNASLAGVQAPRMVRPMSQVSVHVNVSGAGIGVGEALNLKLRNGGGEVVAQTDFYLSGDSADSPPAEQVLVFQSGLRKETYELELTVSGEPEVDLNDNRFSFTVEIATGKLRVLYAEGTHEKRPVGKNGHFWNNMEHITRAWEASGDIEFECFTPLDNRNRFYNLAGVTFHNGEMLLDWSRHFPRTREELHQYDVLQICGIQRDNFSEEQMQWVVDWVLERGGGFLMGGGTNSFDVGEYDKTLWERIIPVDMMAFGDGVFREEFSIEIPESVRDHPLWAISADPEENPSLLETMPSFAGMNRVRRSKPGALVLATRKGTGEPVVASQRYGRGRSIAFLPDPNGAWGRKFLTWGPWEGPSVGEPIVLPQGEDFIFNEAAAEMPPGPEPPNPCPWYGQFWVNAIQWLGKNSVRWQRSKLAGRVVAAQARPGEKLPVAAELLPVTELDELLALDVGARLDLPGSRRVRLLYDRDRREFTGDLSVPLELGLKTEIGVLFDVAVDGQDWSQAISVGLHRGNPEFQETAPDPVFLADLARATKGTIIESVNDAVRSSREAAEKRPRESRYSWSEPLWSEWWPWGVFAALFCLEWALRRQGGRNPDVVNSAVAAEVSGSPEFAATQTR